MKMEEKSIIFTFLLVLILSTVTYAESAEIILPTFLPQNNPLKIYFPSLLPVLYQSKFAAKNSNPPSLFQREQNSELLKTVAEVKNTPSLCSGQKSLENQSRMNNLQSSFFQVSLITFIALNVIDYYSTREALKYPGLKEGNPLLLPFVKDPYIFATVKFGLTALSYFNMKAIYKKNKKVAWVVTTISNFALSYIVINNLRLIQRAKQS